MADRASKLFLRALALDPNHSFNLSRYAAHLMAHNREGEARPLLERALQADPENKEALETYAAFLNRHSDPAALTYFQLAVMQYIDHYRYRHLYANSTSAILILSKKNGAILDCNGAALQLLDARQRSDLCRHDRKVFDLIEDGFVGKFRAALKELDGPTPTMQVSTQVVGCSRWHREAEQHLLSSDGSSAIKSKVAVESIPVKIIMTKVESRSNMPLLHLELLDMRKINELMEAHRLIFENVLTSMVMVGPHGGILRCNRHTEKAFGYKKGGLLGAPLSQLITLSLDGLLMRLRRQQQGALATEETFERQSDNPTMMIAHQDTPEQIQQWKQQEQGDGLGATEVEARTRKGQLRHCVVQVSTFTVKGELSYILSIQDITSLKRERDANRLLFERSMTAMIMTSRDGLEVLRYNDGAERTLGYSREEVVGKPLAMLLPPTEDEQQQQQQQPNKEGSGGSKNTSRSGSPGRRNVEALLDVSLQTETEIEFKSKDGSLRTCIVKAITIQHHVPQQPDDPHHQQQQHPQPSALVSVDCVLLTLEDVTAVREAMDVHQHIFDKGLEPLLVLDEHAVVAFFNQTAVETFEYSKDEAVGQPVAFLLPRPADLDALLPWWITGRDALVAVPDQKEKLQFTDETARLTWRQKQQQEVAVKTKSGRIRVCSARVSETVLGQQHRYLIIMLHDATVPPDLNSTVRKLFLKEEQEFSRRNSLASYDALAEGCLSMPRDGEGGGHRSPKPAAMAPLFLRGLLGVSHPSSSSSGLPVAEMPTGLGTSSAQGQEVKAAELGELPGWHSPA